MNVSLEKRFSVEKCLLRHIFFKISIRRHISFVVKNALNQLLINTKLVKPMLSSVFSLGRIEVAWNF